jgi:hypothetical protein
MQIESYRTRLEEFEQSANRELYLYRSGQKDRLEIGTLLSDYSDLFRKENIREIESELERESFESRRKSLQKIRLSLIDQYLDLRTAALDDEIANIQSGQTLLWEGRKIPVSRAGAYLRAESDAQKRRALHERQLESYEEIEEPLQRRFGILQAAAAELGFKNCVEARERITGIQYEKLLNTFEEVLDRLGDKYLERLRVSFEMTLGIAFPEAGAWDAARWEEKNEPPGVFLEQNLAGMVGSAISELEIRPENSGSISFDFETRVRKQPGAFCIPIKIPQEIKIVMTPGNGSRHYAALLHECGHAYSLAWMSPSLPMEHRLLGDRALSECYAFLLENFIQEPEWLARMLHFTKSGDFLRFRAMYRIFLLRRCIGKLRFAVSFYGKGSCDDAPQIYSETMKRYTGLQYLPESWPADSEDPFASADYLRGWALEAMLREYLRTKYGNSWASSRSASKFLKEIWETGFLYRADELCREIGIGDLEPQVLADRLWEGLRY